MTGTRFSSRERLSALLRALLAVFLLSPYIIWAGRISRWSLPDAHEWWGALTTSFGQAALSAVASLAIGSLLFAGLQCWSGRRARAAAEFALLLPNMVPPLFVALGFLNLIAPFAAFPYGLMAVIAAHVILNSGLVAVALDRLVHAKLGGLAEISWVMGASRGLFLRRVAWPFLRADLGCLFLFVFSICFTSFSLPLLLGGERATSLEVVIYDTIRVEGRWDKAVLLAAFQGAVLLTMAWLLPHPFWPPRPARQNLKYLAWGRGGLVFVPAGILFLGWAAGAWHGLGSIEIFREEVLLEALITTAIVALGVGFLHLLIFLLIAYVSPHARLRRFLNGYLSPSPVITGFALLLVPGEGDLWNLLKAMIALTLISLPLLYRWIVHSALTGVDGQVAMARTLGASPAKILFEVVWPQTAPSLMRACGLAALWASGDFALTGILSGQLRTLPLLMEDLIANYRMESAQLLMVPLAAVGLGAYFLFSRVGRYVAR